MHPRSTAPGIVGVVASLLGGAAAAVSTHDYAAHLDRQLHGTHCSFVPGVGEASSDNACTVALQSPYSALMKDKFWGGIPISLFALGAFTFTFALALYLLLARGSAPQRTRLAFFLVTLGPFFASLVMFVISATKLGQFCKVCIVIYVSSLLLFLSGILALISSRRPFGAVTPPVGQGEQPPPEPPKSADPDKTEMDPEPWHQSDKKKEREKKLAETRRSAGSTSSVSAGPPVGTWAAPIGLLAAMGTATALPAAVYAGTMPKYDDRISSCGKLEKPAAPDGVLVKIKTRNPKQVAVTIEDPLCPNCKAFHERLVAEGIYDKLKLHVAVFPLDSECNWNLKAPMHKGACVLAKAVLCADSTGGDPRAVLEWSYEHQEELAAAGKADIGQLRSKVKARFPALDACIDSAEVQKRIEDTLSWARDNKLRVSTPQLFLGDARVCPEDTDIGLSYAVGRLAPEMDR